MTDTEYDMKPASVIFRIFISIVHNFIEEKGNTEHGQYT